MAWVGLAIGVLSTAVSASAQKKEEDAIKASNARQALELEERAQEAAGAAQKAAEEQRRQKDLIASRALALAAFSGGGASDPDVFDILTDIDSEGAYRESLALYQGEQQAKDFRSQARSLREGTAAIERASGTRRAATVLRGAASAYGQYADAYG